MSRAAGPQARLNARREYAGDVPVYGCVGICMLCLSMRVHIHLSSLLLPSAACAIGGGGAAYVRVRTARMCVCTFTATSFLATWLKMDIPQFQVGMYVRRRRILLIANNQTYAVMLKELYIAVYTYTCIVQASACMRYVSAQAFE